MIFIELKPEWFTYLRKRYEQKRYVSSDLRFLITEDALDGAKAYKARDDGKAERYEVAGHYHTFNSIKDILEAEQPECNWLLKIHETQFKNNAKPRI